MKRSRPIQPDFGAIAVGALLESAKYLAGLGFHLMTFKVAVNCHWQAADLDTLRNQYEKLAGFYVQAQIVGNRIKVEDFAYRLAALHSVEPVTRFPCGAGRGVALVDPRGDLWPCHRFGPHQCGGQFRLGRLGEPFNDRLRAAFLNYNAVEDARTDCHNCPAVLTCRNWCYAECVDSTQTFYDPGQNYCLASRILHDEAVRLHDYLRTRRPDILRRILNEQIQATVNQQPRRQP